MHKKDGKVTASLTEVKNRTGDIFAVVDEYGEISITSYNKTRYKIVKVDISDMLDLGEKPEKVKKKAEVKTPKVEAKKEKTPAPVVTQKAVEVKAVATPTPVASPKSITIIPWDKNNMFERNFVEESIKPLISN